jgi:hypothetical protein
LIPLLSPIPVDNPEPDSDNLNLNSSKGRSGFPAEYASGEVRWRTSKARVWIPMATMYEKPETLARLTIDEQLVAWRKSIGV